MKRLLFILLLIILITFAFSFSLEKTKDSELVSLSLTEDEINFIKSSNIDTNILQNYLRYKSFNIYKYKEYEKQRAKSNNYLESVNLINNPNYYSSYENIEKAIELYNHILINKHYYLNEDYIPLNLVEAENYDILYIKRENEIPYGDKEALEQFEKMYKKANEEGISFVAFSIYRSFKKQKTLYYEINKQNDSYSAKPGHSEHQTGKAFDISTKDIGLTLLFEKSIEYEWLINNSYKYGFILRYPKDKENITKFNFEPWHFRYVGVIASTIIHNNNLTLEEFVIKNYELT